MATKIPVDTQGTTQDAVGTIPSLSKQGEVTYRTILLGNGSSFTWDMAQFQSWQMQLNNFGTNGNCVFKISVSSDNRNYLDVPVEIMASAQSVINTPAINMLQSNFGATLYGGPRIGRFMRVSVVTFGSPHTLTLRLSNNSFVSRKNDLLSNQDAAWKYTSPAGGITTAVAVQVRAGSSPAYKQAISFIHLVNAGTGGTEWAVADGAANSTNYLYRGYIGPGQTIILRPELPLIGSGSNALQFVLFSSTNVVVYPYIQGFATN